MQINKLGAQNVVNFTHLVIKSNNIVSNLYHNCFNIYIKNELLKMDLTTDIPLNKFLIVILNTNKKLTNKTRFKQSPLYQRKQQHTNKATVTTIKKQTNKI